MILSKLYAELCVQIVRLIDFAEADRMWLERLTATTMKCGIPGNLRRLNLLDWLVIFSFERALEIIIGRY